MLFYKLLEPLQLYGRQSHEWRVVAQLCACPKPFCSAFQLCIASFHVFQACLNKELSTLLCDRQANRLLESSQSPTSACHCQSQSSNPSSLTRQEARLESLGRLLAVVFFQLGASAGRAFHLPNPPANAHTWAHPQP